MGWREGRWISMSADKPVPYLTQQIIPYIGNKRRLLPLIKKAVDLALPGGSQGKRFLDLFSGSGVVARLAKYLGFEVAANDWEHYSYILTYAYLCIDRRELEAMFTLWGGVEGIIAHLNSLPRPQHEYIARYFCPKDDERPDYRTERLFYTRYNGLFIDKVRNEIESLYPEREVESDEKLYKEKVLLLALLLYGAATHTNTSGVFKAYHKGFGGHSRDALGRIMKPITLPYPQLIDSERRMRVYREDAKIVVKAESAADRPYDIVYLDPPYNQHQYGSNYHMLNTIVLWDAIPMNESISPGKGGQNRAGIRKDWVKTRSDYCYRDRALAAFEDLIGSINSHNILISYSTEGTIPFDSMIDVCAARGKVSLVTDEYVKYRGGRQSLYRLNNNVEFVIIVDMTKRSAGSDRRRIDESILYRKLLLQAKKCYSRERLEEHFLVDPVSCSIGIGDGGSAYWIVTKYLHRIDEKSFESVVERLSGRERKKLLELLLLCECREMTEEIDETIRVLDGGGGDTFVLRLPTALKKICHRKYEELFYRYLAKIKYLKNLYPSLYPRIEGKVSEIEALATRRFIG
jgi:adenine-specific DNA-methyltransferase